MGDAYLNHFAKVYAYTDITASNAPVRKAFDWTRTFTAVPVRNPKSQGLALEPGETLAVFSSSRSTSINNSTAFAITVSPVDSSVYRFTWTSAGANPVFRTPRALTGVGALVVGFTRNTNSTVTMNNGSGIFGTIVVGDTVFVPGVATGDASSPISLMNQGFWVVLATDGDDVVMARPSGTTFSAASENIQLTADSQIQAFSQAGVQVNDQVKISAGFSLPVCRTFSIYAVAPTWFEVVAATPLPAETAVPMIAGIAFYSSAKRYLRIEADQQVVVRINGATGDEVMIFPFVPGDDAQVGWFELGGTVFSLSLVNKSFQTANVLVLSAE